MEEVRRRQGDASSGCGSPGHVPVERPHEERHTGFGYGGRDYPVNRGNSAGDASRVDTERGVWTAQITRRGPRVIGRCPKGYVRSDERILEDICDRIVEAGLDASDVEISVSGGEVTLAGTVRSREDKHRIEDIADEVRGVRALQSGIRATVR